MKRIFLSALVICFLSATVCNAMSGQPRKEQVSPAGKDEAGTKVLDLSKPTPEEKSQMEREAQYKRKEESGFSDTVDSTM